jgi:hypothetical protein
MDHTREYLKNFKKYIEIKKLHFFIWFQYTDFNNLINSNNGIYDMVCGIDFYYSFYDDWVARDINGKHLNRIYPYFHDKKSLKNFFLSHSVTHIHSKAHINISSSFSIIMIIILLLYMYLVVGME